MSKLSFRARALDPSKPMPIYLAEELPDLPEYSAINRAVPQMPSGMEKEEESVRGSLPAPRVIVWIVSLTGSYDANEGRGVFGGLFSVLLVPSSWSAFYGFVVLHAFHVDCRVCVCNK